MKFQPLNDCVLILRDATDEMSEGGILIHTQLQEKKLLGTVEAVGEQVLSGALKKGSRVMFSKYSGVELAFDDKEWLVLREDEILGVVKGEKKAKAEKVEQ